jgi:hypothetical protein
MVRKRPVLCIATVLVSTIFCSAIPQQPPPSDSSVEAMPFDRVTESYAIYSVLLQGKPFYKTNSEQKTNSDQNLRWAIADITVSITDMNPAVPPEGQIKAPPGNVDAFKEAVRDFEIRKYQRIQLLPMFQLTKSYDLLDTAQVNEFRQARASMAANSDLQAKYAGYPGITFFSQVFFNSTHTAALVYINVWCGSLCSAGEWVFFEGKVGPEGKVGGWVRRSGITNRRH